MKKIKIQDKEDLKIKIQDLQDKEDLKDKKIFHLFSD